MGAFRSPCEGRSERSERAPNLDDAEGRQRESGHRSMATRSLPLIA
jgi:hypothetical protein